MNIEIEELKDYKKAPYKLLLSADPSIDKINSYIKKSKIFICKDNSKIIGIIVLINKGQNSVEIINISVDNEYQNKGIGTKLINHAIKYASENNYKEIEIGTANSSFAQLYLYQKCGFRFKKIIKDFFINNYKEPIYENKLQCLDMLVLSKKL